MANTTGQAGFWGSNFNPQQAATQWGHGLQGALTNSSGATTAQDYGKQLGRALFSGPMMGAMPQAVQDRAQAWFGSAPEATPAAPTGTQTAPVAAPPPATATATPMPAQSPSPATANQPMEQAFSPGQQQWNAQMGAWLPNGQQTGLGQQMGARLSQFGTRVR